MTINYPSYPANYRPLANTAVDQNWRGNPMSMFAKGGRANTKPICVKVPRSPGYAKGGLHDEAKKVRDAGVGGDELIIHINRKEYDELVKHWGEPTINPHTGMPQFTPFYKQKWFAPVAALASAALMATGVGAPIGASLLGAVGLEGAVAGSILGASVPSIVGNALIGGATGAVTGGGLKGGLTGAALGGLGTIGAGALGMTGPGVTGTGEGGFSGWYDSLGGAFSGGSDAVLGKGGAEAMKADYAAQVASGAAEAGQDLGLKSAGPLAFLTNPKTAIPAALLGAAAIGGMSGPKELPGGALQQVDTDPNLKRPLTITPLMRQRNFLTPPSYYTYGQLPEPKTYTQPAPVEEEPPTTKAARGGHMPAPGGPLSQTGRYVAGPGTGRSDSIDAKLSDGEYVIDAETVALLGDGSSKAGAKRLDQFRANIRKQKGRALAKGDFSPDAKRPEHYLMGGRA
jgi:hypothetical protein